MQKDNQPNCISAIQQDRAEKKARRHMQKDNQPNCISAIQQDRAEKENNLTKPLLARLIVAAHACFWSNRLTTGVLEVCEWHLAKKNSKPAIPSMPVALTKQLQEL